MWKRLKAIRYGEAALWVGFVALGLRGVTDGSYGESAVTLAGLCALAAIGVRATRPDGDQSNAT